VGVINIFSEFFLGGDMKKKIASLLAGALAVLCVAVTANATAQFYNFESSTSDWAGGSGVTLSNGAPTHGAYSLILPVDNVVSNDVNGDLGNTVWTDFYTIPVRYSSAVNPNPVVDPAATGQFYVNSNGFWVTMSGSGGSVINVCTQSLVTGMTYPTVTQYTAFYHVSVFQDYAAKKWSLFVNNVPLAENLSFIDQDAVAHDWFQVQNFGGHSTNVCWLDDFLLTNAMVTTGGSGTNTLTAVVPGTTLPVADALVNFGSTADPRPTNETVGVVGAGSIALAFGRVVDDGRKYVVYGTTDPSLGGLVSNGLAAISSGSAYFTNSPFGGTTNRYFYKLLTISSNGVSVAENEEAYAGYKQTLSAGYWQWVGVPVGLDDYTLGGTLGKQLGASLAVGSKMVVRKGDADTEKYEWNGDDWGAANVAVVIPPGQGMMIRSTNSVSTILAGLQQTNEVSITIYKGWNSIAWPYDNGSWDLPTGESGDYLYLQRNNAPLPAKNVSGTWRQGTYGTLGLLTALTPVQAGEGVLILRTNASPATWTPTRTP
jgi:hypothetical protein